MKSLVTIRSFPGGLAAGGLPYTVKLHLDDSTLASGTTTVAGQFEYSPNLHPGPHYWTATDAAADPDVIRVGSSKSAGSGGTYSFYELPILLRLLGTGVVPDYLNELAVTYDGAGLDLDVATGAANILGLPAVVAVETEHTVVTARDAANTKACYLVLEATGLGEAEEGKIVFKDVCGAAAASPSLPTLTQTDALYQFPLASFILPTSASTTLSTLVDLRAFVGPGGGNPQVSNTARRSDPTSTTTTTSTTGADIASLTTTVTLLDGVVYDIEARAHVLVKAPVGQEVQVAVYIGDVALISAYIGSEVSADYVGITNVHTLENLTGDGGAETCGVRWRVDASGTATALTGVLLVIATPRA